MEHRTKGNSKIWHYQTYVFMSLERFTYLHFGNLDMIEKLYSQFLTDPMKVEPSWRYFFEGVEFADYQTKEVQSDDLRIFRLIAAYRRFGHLQARTNPILLKPPSTIPLLELEILGFDHSELSKKFPTYGLFSEKTAPLAHIIASLKETYCGSKSIEYIGLHSAEMESWIQNQIEPSHFVPQFNVDQKKSILSFLNKAELFEIFLHTKYVGQKRFSLEGGETLIPILGEIIERGSEDGVDEFVIGMSHRGRLNVLANILNKSYAMIFSEFEDYDEPNSDIAGDVKYHRGFSSTISTVKGKVHINLTANPSHLESVDPVVQGKVKAKQTAKQDISCNKVMPILIHGDASISGQGVVYETMQMGQLEGYTTGGTLHIIINNFIGFTTLPSESRSSRYCTDIAIPFGSPVFHVNAEDPEGCVFATQLAMRLRHLFKCDVFIDLNCYRKYGHNEGDEPAFTQPLQYQNIRKKKSIREIYRDHLIEEGFLEKKMIISLEEDFKKALHFELEELKLSKEVSAPEAFGGVWKDYRKVSKADIIQPAHTAVSKDVLKEIAERISSLPENLNVHKKLLQVIEERKKMGLEERPINWAMAEHLALGSLLWESIHVRLAGQDCRRGTFTQRHAVWVDQNNGEFYFPLAHLKEEQGIFTILNSPLSEFAALAFEYGYSLAYPSALIMWEAQYGDFANGAQIVFDQYIAAAAQKWQRYSGLVILLPHGYEGQGPEHSSGRIERFLQLASESNMQIVYPTTPAQYFHLLRRQVKRDIRLPLIVFTPKNLLRHPACTSELEDLTKGRFYEVLDDPKRNEHARRLILCTGRIFYDLMEERTKREADHVAIIRIEQLYPLHQDALIQIIDSYKEAKNCYWVQEEPRNMGGYGHLFPILQELLPKNMKLQYAGRNRSASPATGSRKSHEKERMQLMKMAFEDEREY